MKIKLLPPMAALVILTALAAPARPDSGQEVKEARFDAPNRLMIKLRMEGPYDADVPLQVVCYFKHREGGDRTLGAAVELDEKLGGVIASLRSRGEFEGEALETLLLTPPKGTIKAQRLLLIGLGEEDSLSADLLERVGRVALREAARLGVERTAFAPLLRDQGNSKLGAGDVERAVLGGVILAYDTERRLRDQGLAPAWRLSEWEVEAGPAYFDDTRKGARQAIEQAQAKLAARSPAPYAGGGK